MPFLGGRGQASRGYFGGGTTPGAPTVGIATPGDGQISLAFTAPTFNGGLTITTYQYALSTDSYATWTTRSTGTTASPLVITGLSNGTSYSIKIRAVNSLGEGIASDATTAVIPFGAADAPTSLVSTPGDGQLSVAFTPAFNGGRTITTYQYALSTDSYATWTNRTTGTTASPLVITGLSNGTSYGVKLRAVTVDFGAGTASAAATATSPFGAAIATTTAGSDQTTTPTAPTTSAPTSTQSFGTLIPVAYTSGSGTWTNPYPSGATTGTGTLNGSAGTTHFVWGTSSGSYPNEVGATSNAYVRTTWPRGTAVYYKAKIINTSCVARFNGTVNSNGSSTTVTFEYGTSSGVYPSSVSAGTVTALTATAVTADVSSLSAGTYYFRTKAVNAAGTTYGTQQSIAISAKSATAASEQSFTPPTVGTLYELVCAGGGGGEYSGSGGGGGAVAYYSSAAAPTSLTYAVGGGGSSGNPGGTSTISFSGVSMSGGGGGVGYFSGGHYAGSSGVASGGTSNYPTTAFTGGSYGYIGDSDVGYGGGGGAGGAGNGSATYNSSSQIYAYGGDGGPAQTVNGNSFGAGGGGYGDDYRYPPGGPSVGNSPYSDYGRGGFVTQNYANVYSGTGGLVRFKYYGP